MFFIFSVSNYVCLLNAKLKRNQTKWNQLKPNKTKPRNRNTVAMSVMFCFKDENEVCGLSLYLCCKVCIFIHFVAFSDRLQVWFSLISLGWETFRNAQSFLSICSVFNILLYVIHRFVLSHSLDRNVTKFISKVTYINEIEIKTLHYKCVHIRF